MKIEPKTIVLISLVIVLIIFEIVQCIHSIAMQDKLEQILMLIQDVDLDVHSLLTHD